MGFRIDWAVDDADWEQARDVAARFGPGSDYDVALLALENLLPGTVRFGWDGTPMLPVPVSDPTWESFSVWPERNRLGVQRPEETDLARGFGVLVTDLAWQFAHIVEGGRFESAPDGAHAQYNLSVDALAIRFLKNGERVVILSNQLIDRGWMLVVPGSEFVAAVRSFLHEFAGALRRHAPALLPWETFAPLRPYA